MRALIFALGLSVAALGAPAHADQVINLSEWSPSAEALHELARDALVRRRYSIEQDTPTMLVGEQDNLRVEVLIEPPRITIRWKEGFGHPKDQWLRNLKTEVLWILAE